VSDCGPTSLDTAAVAALLGIDDPGEARRIAARAGEVAARLPAPAGSAIRVAAAALDVASRLIAAKPLAELAPPERDWVCTTLASHGGGPLLEALKLPVLLAAGADRFSEAASGAAGATAGTCGTGPGRPDPPLNCTSSAQWPSRTTADAVVIGSGAGGAMVARTLARSGADTVIIEAGRRYAVDEFRQRPPLDRFLDLYGDTGRDDHASHAGHHGNAGLTIALGRPPVVLMSGRGVGGTTLVNSGTCYRPPSRVVSRWRQPFGINMDGFGELLDEVERTLQVAQAPLGILGSNGLIALAGARELGWRAAPLRRNAPGCGGCCQCAVGCPRNAKNGVHLNALPQACEAGARIVTNAWVQRVLTERAPGGRPAAGGRRAAGVRAAGVRAAGVRAAGVRAAGVRALRPDGSALEILAPLVVVAAGALQTPPLLRRSGLGGHPGLGRGLAIHPALSVAGRFDRPVVSWSGILQSVGIEELHDQGILIEATAGPPGMSSFVLPGVGRALRSELDRADRLAFLGAMIADAPSGSVHGRSRPVVRYGLAERDGAKLRTAIVAMGRVLFAAGAREVLSGLPGRPAARNTADLAAHVAGAPVSALHLAAFHPTGSARMGADARRCPVDPEGRLRGADGVWMADSSVLPTCPEVNPQLTIMAMALAVAGRCCP
jgi:choline dehydrogenase-like flavoprotein